MKKKIIKLLAVGAFAIGIWTLEIFYILDLISDNNIMQIMILFISYPIIVISVFLIAVKITFND